MARNWVVSDPDDAETGIDGLYQPEPGFFLADDARLIAAAPDLLAACKDAAEAISTLELRALGIDQGSGYPYRDELLRSLEAAMATAGQDIKERLDDALGLANFHKRRANEANAKLVACANQLALMTGYRDAAIKELMQVRAQLAEARAITADRCREVEELAQRLALLERGG